MLRNLKTLLDGRFIVKPAATQWCPCQSLLDCVIVIPAIKLTTMVVPREGSFDCVKAEFYLDEKENEKWVRHRIHWVARGRLSAESVGLAKGVCEHP